MSRTATPEAPNAGVRAPAPRGGLTGESSDGCIAADRDLFFGPIALQNGLIDQGQLVAAFQAWTRDRMRPKFQPLWRALPGIPCDHPKNDYLQ
jgi:hypothetical protein